MNISSMKSHFRNPDGLLKMINKFGRQETVQRLAWLHDCQEAKVETLVDQFLTDDYVDEKGVKGGNYFWGDL